MSREIMNRPDVEIRNKVAGRPHGNGEAGDGYGSRLLKYIPAEVVTVYIFVEGLIRQGNEPGLLPGLLWSSFLILLALTPVYLWRVQHITKWQQLLLSGISFGVWVFSLGGPFVFLDWYRPLYGAVLLPLVTFGVAAIKPGS